MKTHRLLIGVGVVLALAAVLAGGCQRKGRAGEYYSKAHKYSIIPPASWVKKPGNNIMDVMFSCPDGLRSADAHENINVVTETLPQAMSLEDYTRAAIATMEAVIKDYQQVSLTDFELGNTQGKRLVSTFAVGDKKAQSVTYFAARDTTAFVFSGTATPDSFSKFEATFDECARTFRVE